MFPIRVTASTSTPSLLIREAKMKMTEFSFESAPIHFNVYDRQGPGSIRLQFTKERNSPYKQNNSILSEKSSCTRKANTISIVFPVNIMITRPYTTVTGSRKIRHEIFHTEVGLH